MTTFQKKWNQFKLKLYRTLAPRLLWMQLFCVLLVLTLIPLVSLIYIQWYDARATIKNPVLQYNQEMAEALTGEIRKSFSVSQKSLTGMAALLGTLNADPWKQKIAITEMSLNSPFFQKIVTLNAQGQEISSSIENAVFQDRSADPAWIAVRSGEIYISDVRIQNDYIPCLTLAVPIKFANEIIGALISEVNLRSMWEEVDNLRHGKTGHAYLVDEKGRIITHPDKKLIFKDTNSLFPKSTQKVTSGQTGSALTTGPDGKNWLISYAPVGIPSWGLIVVKSEEEIYAPFISKIRFHSILLSIPAILLSLLVSFIAAKFFVRPINKFTNETRKLLKGDLVKKYPVYRKDELGEIGFHFNRLIGRYYALKDLENLAKVGQETSAITHEIKNSLHMMRTYVNLLPKKHKDKKFMEDFAEIIPPELDSLKEKMQDIGNFVQNKEFSLGKIEIIPFLKKIILMNKLLIEEANIKFETDLTANNEKIVILGDEFHLKRVFMNLFKNALEATPSGGKIIFSASKNFCVHPPGVLKKKKDCLDISLTNTGKGIPKDNLKIIFEAFFTTKKLGLGLGLSLCKEIVQKHNGHIKVTSVEDKETTFLVCLPTLS